MSRYTEQEDDITFSEPILAKKAVRMGVSFAEKTEWEVKNKDKWTEEQRLSMQPLLGQKVDACKLTLQISDDSVQTEHADAKPRLTIEDQFNIEPYPYPDAKTGAIKKLGRQKLFELEGALGFDPVFKQNGEIVAPFITRTGNKVAPKGEGVKRVLNPDFFDTYFDNLGNPIMSNWEGKVIYADVEVETSEQYGAKNIIKRYVKAPQV